MGRTAISKLSLKKLGHGFRVPPALRVTSYNAVEVVQPSAKGGQVTLVVYRRFVHMVENLLNAEVSGYSCIR
jgi:hypothetical protein